jgi:hypothetical protein
MKKKEIIKKRDIWNKEDNTRYKIEVEQRYGKPHGEESNRNLGNSKTKNTVEGHSTLLTEINTGLGWKAERRLTKLMVTQNRQE